MSFPLLIEYQNKIFITPTRLKIAREMMFEKLLHDPISAYLSIVYEREFQQKTLDILEVNNCIVKDPINNDYWIYIRKCKLFHPFLSLIDVIFKILHYIPLCKCSMYLFFEIIKLIKSIFINIYINKILFIFH